MKRRRGERRKRREACGRREGQATVGDVWRVGELEGGESFGEKPPLSVVWAACCCVTGGLGWVAVRQKASDRPLGGCGGGVSSLPEDTGRRKAERILLRGGAGFAIADFRFAIGRRV